MQEGRILGIDYGRRRIGLALSDALGLTAQPLERLDIRDGKEALDKAAAAAARHEAAMVVVGLPRNMDGSEGPMAAEVRQFATLLGERLNLPVHLWDERLTSREASRALGRSGASRAQRKKRVDVVAAQLLLQSFIEHLDAPSTRNSEDSPEC